MDKDPEPLFGINVPQGYKEISFKKSSKDFNYLELIST